MARDLVLVTCQECGITLRGDDPELRLELSDDNEPVILCIHCWSLEFWAEPN